MKYIALLIYAAISAQTLSAKEMTMHTQQTTVQPKIYEKTKEKVDALGPVQDYVTQKNGTEPPFLNKYWNNKKAGLYVDIVSGEPLFFSFDKFNSGTGWPSFTKPVNSHYIVEETDSSAGMVRTEVRSKYADSHLGHVFPDGPSEQGGLRYCINSASLRFIPLNELEQEGYGEFVGAFEQKQ